MVVPPPKKGVNCAMKGENTPWVLTRSQTEMVPKMWIPCKKGHSAIHSFLLYYASDYNYDLLCYSRPGCVIRPAAHGTGLEYRGKSVINAARL